VTADRTVEFGLDGVTYTIDLSDKNAGKLHKALEPYVAASFVTGHPMVVDGGQTTGLHQP
jgi:hypothetical protein